MAISTTPARPMTASRMGRILSILYYRSFLRLSAIMRGLVYWDTEKRKILSKFTKTAEIEGNELFRFEETAEIEDNVVLASGCSGTVC
jgi:hypothetical protein